MNYRFTYANDLSEPVSLDEAKNYLKIDYDTDDVLLTEMIRSAREQAELFCNRSFVPKTIEFSTKDFEDPVLLPFPNHNDITSVKVDGNKVEYTLMGITQLEIEVTAIGKELKVIYTAGGDITKAEKETLKKVVADMYRNRDESGSLSENAIGYLLTFKVYQ